MKKLMLLIAAACFVFVSCNNKPAEEQVATEENTEVTEEHHCCHEMTEEQKAFKADWENWENQTAERKTELIAQAKECFDKKMAECEVDIFHKIVSELIDEHEKETTKLWDDILSLHDTTNKLQAQLYDVQNQNCEYENRFKHISYAASFRIPETKMSFVDGEPLSWKSDDGNSSPPSPKE